MRLVIVVLCALAIPAHAQSGPPSKTLERAIKLYDKKDFYSASIELQKVLDGQTGDDAPNKQLLPRRSRCARNPAQTSRRR
jgi:hypothetical protein